MSSDLVTFADKIESIDLSSAENPSSYELRVAQTIPIFLRSRHHPMTGRQPTSGGRSGNDDFFCLGPHNVTEGSREVDAEPWNPDGGEGDDDDENMSTALFRASLLGWWIVAIGSGWLLMK